jgi:hypothetical protein
MKRKKRTLLTYLNGMLLIMIRRSARDLIIDLVLAIRKLPFGQLLLKYSIRSFGWMRPRSVVDRTRRFALATKKSLLDLHTKRHPDAYRALKIAYSQA